MAEVGTGGMFGGVGPDPSTPILVTIGASAGGVGALQQFFKELPQHTGAAFVVIVHLDPARRSELPQVLATRTSMPVVAVHGSQKIEADHVYVIPPDRRLQLVDHHISAEEFDEPRGLRLPIDLFFRSVAERLGDGFAVILSGAGSDGAIGVRAVKESGGIILVQDPEEAEYSSMPRAAIATGVADFILPVGNLVKELAELIRAKQAGGNAAEAAAAADEQLLFRLLAHVRMRTGHDFSKYKRSTVLRRINRRMQVTRADSLDDYYEILRQSAEEAQALLGDLLISVTTFFRDRDVFELLKSEVVPRLFDAKASSGTIRVWTCGCATGEEAYSIAMLLLEERARREQRLAIQVFGSDLDIRALATAREGRYPTAIENDVSDERLRRFFHRQGEGYRIRQELRDVVLFAAHDMLKDPPFSRVDLISCRNVMIYLDRELQEQVCSTFHYSLNPGGYLLLGSSEMADSPPGLFRPVDRNARIYQAVSSDKPRLLPRLLGPLTVRDQVTLLGRPANPTTALAEAASHRHAIERAAPPSILVDETHRVIHLSENAGRFLMPAGGPLSGDVVDLARPELRFELRSALHRMFEQDQSTLSLPIMVRFNGSPHRVYVQVKPADTAEKAERRHALVLFIEGEAVDTLLAEDLHPNDETVRRLTQELELTQARLRTVREDSDQANEELRAANEELQSINEEYRSTSEELETSKEELQSINEELQTVNSELKLKLETISRAHSDLQNLMAATDFGTLFLDSTLRIKRFTERATELFSITPNDEGRPITDFTLQLEYDGLIADSRNVLSHLTPIRRELRARNERWYDLRMRPYRTVDDKIDGVVITFIDITERLQVEEALRQSEQQLRQQKNLVELSRDPIFIWELEGGIVAWNRGSEELYGYSRAEALGKRKNELLGTAVPGSSFEELKARLLREGSWSGELNQRAKNGRLLTVESRLQMDPAGGEPRLVLESTRDVTERKLWDERQRMLQTELSHRVKNALTIVQAIAHQTLRSTGPEEFVRRFEERLSALAVAHNALIDSDWKGADLASLARQQLQPYTSSNPDRMRMAGEAVTLSPELATPFGLVLYELGSNAAKHGAWSTPNGMVELSWSVTSGAEPCLIATWREWGGPPVRADRKAGLGTGLIDGAISGAKVSREFSPEGLVCRIELPLPPSRAPA